MSDSSAKWQYQNTAPKVDFSNPDEMIRANGAAEAARTDRLKEEVEEYSQILSELRQLYDRNNELVQKLQFINRNTTEEFRTMLESHNQQISDKLQELQAWDHEAFQEGMLGSIADTKEQILGSIEASSNRSEERMQASDEFSHKENVRVYRNVQASMITELSRQTEQLNAKLEQIREAQVETQEQRKSDRSQTLLQKITFGLVIAVMALQLLEGAGLIAILTSLMR